MSAITLLVAPAGPAPGRRAAKRSRRVPSRCWADSSTHPRTFWHSRTRANTCCVPFAPRAWCSFTCKGALRRRTCSTSSLTLPTASGGEFKPIASSAPGVDVGELLPQTARWMHKAAVVRSVYHNGGCHKTLPMYNRVRRESPRRRVPRERPPQHGFRLRVPRSRQSERVADVCVPFPARSAGGKCARRPGRKPVSSVAATIRSRLSAPLTWTSLRTTSGGRRWCAASRA